MVKLVCGIGINNADYTTSLREELPKVNGKRKYRILWACPFYKLWASMLQRCYSEKRLIKDPSYIGCSVHPDWHSFMSFRSWMIEQDWEGMELDKDILFEGNRVYGPDTCVFVDHHVNTFLINCAASRGDYPVGVHLHKECGKFVALIRDFRIKKQKYLGIFDTAEEAHQCYVLAKHGLAMDLASIQKDRRVAKALISRYAIHK